MLKPVHALVGTDLFLQLDALGAIVRAAPKDVQRMDFDGETAELAEVLDELRSFAMFSSSKLVVVRTADDLITRFRESLEDYVRKPSAGSTLVLRCDTLPKTQRIYKAIAAGGQVTECVPPKDVTGWIVKRGKDAHGLAIREAAEVLYQNVGDDLGRLDNEIAKLALQVEGGVVDEKAVKGSVVFQREQEIWDMTNDVAAGKTGDAAKRWRQLVMLDSSAEYRAVTWLTIWLEKSRKALGLKKKGWKDYDIGKEFKLWPAEQATILLRTANSLGEERVNRLIDELSRVDYRSKSGKGAMVENVERFLLEAGRR